MKRTVLVLVLLSVIPWGCQKPRPAATADDKELQELKALVAQGKYEEGLLAAKRIVAQVPPSPALDQVLYLQGYLQVFGRGDFGAVRQPLRQLLGSFPNSRYALEGQKLLADCQFWQGHYQTGAKEYRKLAVLAAGKGLEAYALMQVGNCLLLDDKVADALDLYRDVVNRFPGDPMADSSQLLVVNSFLKLQNFKQAKAELNKLLAGTRDPGLQESARQVLKQMAEEESSRKGKDE